MKKIKWINSIKARLILTLICIVLFILCFSLGLNMVFLENYYEESRVQKLIEVYENIRYEKYDNLSKIESDNNITIYKLIVSSDKNSLYLDYPSNLSKEEFQNIEDTIKEYYLTEKKDLVSIKYKTDSYIVCKMFDPIIQSNYLDLFARYDNSIIYIRLNMENISEIVNTANTFLLYISFLAMFEGAILMTLVSNKFTKPILKLSKIANNMANLNFKETYDEIREDEVGVLGDSMNKLSNNLQETISNLEKANQQLAKDLKEKEKIDEMRKTFVSDVSHELKTPIALIQGYAEGLKYSIADDESRDFYCQTIIEESEKMNDLVKKITSLSQIEYGYTKVELEKFDIKEIIEYKLHTMQLLLEQNNIKLNTHLYSQIVEMDLSLLDEILNNYLSNAINHISGNKILNISFENYSNDKIKISIFNTGENIPENELENLWIKFYKVDKSRTREYGGSGIGLSIVKAILDNVNQEYGVLNKENGVEFWFTLKKVN